MTIYEIDQAILDCLDFETGEVLDSEALQALQMQREQKIDNVACWHKNLLAEAEAIKAEEKNLMERRKAKETKAEQLKNWLSQVVAGQKIETTRNKISWRKSESVELLNEDAISDTFKEEVTTVKIDKAAIKEAIKAGVIVSGAVLVEKQNIQIK